MSRSTILILNVSLVIYFYTDTVLTAANWTISTFLPLQFMKLFNDLWQFVSTLSTVQKSF